ncbi:MULTISPECIES: phage tail fiber protein [unclassified Serratia (in: enterobacteria)]|uniref:phage tail fiber protein n=1 Tax=unclassified Serratia (in: enterobacteria) TaxID=2647522 RepID=UPI003075EE8D
MAVISGILKDPIGGPRVGVVIELRAVRTSATVVNLARSQSITDATGKYTLTVEPGAYDVMITAGGRQPERVGGITVALNSQNGTLNDFLTIPGEADLTPEIVATVDRMRADAAASAASAATSANGLSGALKNLNFSPTEAVANAAWRKVGTVKNMAQGGQTIVIRIGGTASYNGHPNANGLLDIVIRTGSGSVTGVNTVGRAAVTAFITNGIGTVSSTQLISDLGLIETAANTFDLYLKFNPFVSGISAAISATSISHIADNWTWGKTEVADPAIVLEREIIKVWTEGSLSNPLRLGDAGVGSATSIAVFDADAVGVNQFCRYPANTPGAPSTAPWAGLQGGYDNSSRWEMSWVMGSTSVYLQTRCRSTTGVWGQWVTIWHGGNTTVDANGFIKKASPIVKLFGDGTSELNDQSQGITTERISEGVYRVSGVMGFNSDPAWGGPNGGIGLPKDNNDLALVWVDYEVDETGDLLIKTFHRINSTAPKFAQNIVAGYKEGQPIDIPAGRWIDLRVEMPAGDEPEPIPEPDAVPDTDQQSEAETKQPAVTDQEGSKELGQAEAESENEGGDEPKQ